MALSSIHDVTSHGNATTEQNATHIDNVVPDEHNVSSINPSDSN